MMKSGEISRACAFYRLAERETRTGQVAAVHRPVAVSGPAVLGNENRNEKRSTYTERDGFHESVSHFSSLPLGPSSLRSEDCPPSYGGPAVALAKAGTPSEN